MEITNQASYKTELQDRILWFDGQSTVKPEQLESFIKRGITEGLCVTHLTDEIKQYNRLVSPQERISIKEDVDPFDYSWNIPIKFKELDVLEYVLNKLCDEYDELKYSEKEFDKRLQRTADEMRLYAKMGLEDVLRVLIFIINTFQANNIVWGVGRGSSVASFVLYLIGVHDVDSIKYNLDINDFLR